MMPWSGSVYRNREGGKPPQGKTRRSSLYRQGLLTVLQLALATGCYRTPQPWSPRLESRPRRAGGWKEHCGYESCGPRVDSLVTADLRIRVESFNANVRGEDFYILVHFSTTVPIPPTYTFDPSLTYVVRSNGQTNACAVFPIRGAPEGPHHRPVDPISRVRYTPGAHFHSPGDPPTAIIIGTHSFDCISSGPRRACRNNSALCSTGFNGTANR